MLYFLQLRKKKYKKVSSGIEPKFLVSETSVLTITPCDPNAPQAAPNAPQAAPNAPYQNRTDVNRS